MSPHDLGRVLEVVRRKRTELKASGVDEYDINLQPLICSMLEALLQHAAEEGQGVVGHCHSRANQGHEASAAAFLGCRRNDAGSPGDYPPGSRGAL